MKSLIKDYFLAFIITTIIGTFLAFFIDYDRHRGFDFIFLCVLIVIISFGIPNTIFLILLSFFKSMRIFVSNKKLLVIEVFLMYAFFYLVDYLIRLIPYEYQFYRDQSLEGKIIFFDFEFELLYSFVLLFLIMLFLKKFILKK